MLPDHISIQTDPAALVRRFLDGKEFTRIAVVTDDLTNAHCYLKVKNALPAHVVINVPSGEEFKNIETCALIWQKLTDLAFDRHSLMIIVGGGVLGDMAGFCAATYKRGINFVLMPTTLLAQSDASVGGKLGIDFQHYKNHIGVFQEPTATLIATDFLNTLPLRELRSGFAEIIKHCIISDPGMWNKITSQELDGQDWMELISHSVSFKYSVIVKDPREKGLRKILNFGHSIGHAIESYLLGTGNRIFHGEAIAIGMITEAFIAMQKGMLTSDELKAIRRYLLQIFGKLQIPTHEEIMPIIIQDKKNKGDKILMALPKGIGNAQWDVAVSMKEIAAALDYYAN